MCCVMEMEIFVPRVCVYVLFADVTSRLSDLLSPASSSSTLLLLCSLLIAMHAEPAHAGNPVFFSTLSLGLLGKAMTISPTLFAISMH